MAETILERIVNAVRLRLDSTPPLPGLSEMARSVASQRLESDPRSLLAALSAAPPAVIAECKRASPSAGTLRDEFDPVALARAYEAGGAAAISVVTEPDFFAGDPAWIAAVRAAVRLPVLRKDFVVCARQLEESAVLGADAVLLIQRLLDEETLEELLTLAGRLHLEVLLEVFADEDPARAVASGARLIGVNARDLASFTMRLDRVAAMAAAIPGDRTRVAESGINQRSHMESLHEAGYHAFLVGEHLVRAGDPEGALRRLLGS